MLKSCLAAVAALIALAIFSAPALAQGCPYKVGEPIDAEFVAGDWRPAVILGINVPESAYCGVILRYMDGPAEFKFRPDQVFTVSLPHVRPGQLPRPNTEAEQQLQAGTYHICPTGGLQAGYDAEALAAGAGNDLVVENFQRAIAESYTAITQTETHVYFDNFQLAAPLMTSEKDGSVGWAPDLRVDQMVQPARADVWVCYQYADRMVMDGFNIAYACFSNVTKSGKVECQARETEKVLGSITRYDGLLH